MGNNLSSTSGFKGPCAFLKPHSQGDAMWSKSHQTSCLCALSVSRVSLRSCASGFGGWPSCDSHTSQPEKHAMGQNLPETLLFGCIGCFPSLRETYNGRRPTWGRQALEVILCSQIWKHTMAQMAPANVCVRPLVCFPSFRETHNRRRPIPGHRA